MPSPSSRRRPVVYTRAVGAGAGGAHRRTRAGLSTDDRPVIKVRGSDLPARLPLAYASDYPAALHAVGWLHRQFHDQLAANNEGTTHLSQSLHVIRVGTDAPPQLLYFSAVNGSR